MAGRGAWPVPVIGGGQPGGGVLNSWHLDVGWVDDATGRQRSLLGTQPATYLGADVVFVSSLGLEGGIDRLVSASGYHGPLITASQEGSTRQMEEDGQQITDPHAWNSMKNGVQYATNVMNALIAADPQDADDFRQRGVESIQQLQTLDSWAKATFAAVPPEKRKVLTSHDAFGYFGQEYGVAFLASVGFSTEAEASVSDVAQLITQLKGKNVHAYFMENQTDLRL